VIGANPELKLGKSPRATAYTLSPFVPAQAGTQESEAVSFWVYILASRRNGTLYIGMTDDLVRRSWEHRTGAVPGFTRKYGVKMLVWFEQHETRESALQRERRLKKWNRAWKLQLIERFNPSWKDLADELTP
jgi:putative endonuclease